MSWLGVSTIWIRLLLDRLTLLLFVLSSAAVRFVLVSGVAALSQHLSTWVDWSMLSLLAYLTIEMATNTNLVPASSWLFYLLAILTCSNVTPKNRLLCLDIAHLPCSIWCWRTIPISSLAPTSTTFVGLLCLRVCTLESIAIVLRTISWLCVLLGLLSGRLLLWWANAHELWCRWLLNSRFDQFLVLCLINTAYSCCGCVRFCACSTALIVYSTTCSFLLTLEQLLHKLIVLIDGERFVLPVGTLHRLLMGLVLNEALGVIVIWSACLERSRLPRLSSSRLAVVRWVVCLVRLWRCQICWRRLLHLVDGVVLLLPRILRSEMGSCCPLVVMGPLLARILASGWFWAVQAEIVARVASVDNHIEHRVLLHRLRVVRVVRRVLEMLLLLHLLLLHHLLLLVLAQPVELVVLHSLFLLQRHRHLLVRISKEIVLFDVGLADLSSGTVEKLALVRLHHWWCVALVLALRLADEVVLQAVEILLRNRLCIFHECLTFRRILNNRKY